jgi:hypothetical protein
VSCAVITFCVASQRVFIVVSMYFVIDSVRKLLDTPSYLFQTRSESVMLLFTLVMKVITDVCYKK